MLLLLLLCRRLTAAWLVRNWDVQGMAAFINRALNGEGASFASAHPHLQNRFGLGIVNADFTKVLACSHPAAAFLCR